MLTSKGRHLTNCVELHPDNKNWRTFLTGKEIKSEYRGWVWYVSSNHHYIVNPRGFVECRFGFHGYNLWNFRTGQTIK